MTDLSIAEYRALAEFRYQIRRFLQFSAEAARAHGLEPSNTSSSWPSKDSPNPPAPPLASLPSGYKSSITAP